MELTTLNVQVQDDEECESSFELRSKLDTLTKLYEAEKKKTEELSEDNEKLRQDVEGLKRSFKVLTENQGCGEQGGGQEAKKKRGRPTKVPIAYLMPLHTYTVTCRNSNSRGSCRLWHKCNPPHP